MKRVAVTGGNGFIGRYLIDDLLANGMAPVGLARSEESLALIRSDADRRMIGPDPESMDAALAGCDALVHLAGRRSRREDDPEMLSPFVDSDTPMLDGLLRAAKTQGVRKVVLASSIAVYSKANNKPYREAEAAVPLNPYGTNKLLSETHAAFWSRSNDIPVVSLRIAACFGHGERGTAALMRFVGQAARGETLTVQQGGTFCIDQIYVGDVCAAIRAALDTVDAQGPFNIGAGRAFSVLEMAETANTVFGNSDNLVVEGADRAPPANRDNHMDISRARELLGWHPQTDLAGGIAAIRDALEAEAASTR